VDDEDDLRDDIAAALEDLFGAQDDYEDAVTKLDGLRGELGDLGMLRGKRRRRRAIDNYTKRMQERRVAKVGCLLGSQPKTVVWWCAAGFV